ncbi:MAG: hypothetical protein GY906_20645, partial [bacterium]|nr:hypothetical protein [bacterium]
MSDPTKPPTEAIVTPGYSGKTYTSIVYRQVGFEGIRFTLPDPRGILAKWRVNLREALSYTILVTNPSLMGHSVHPSWSDEQCIDLLAQLQEKYQLKFGVVPAGAYSLIIGYLTDCYLNPKGDKPQMGKQCPIMDEIVTKMGPRPVLDKTSSIRHQCVVILSDSGTHIYNTAKKPNSVHMKDYLKNTEWFPKEQWADVLTFCEDDSPAWKSWAVGLESVFDKVDSPCVYLDSDGNRRIDSSVLV